jgi:uncharacterized protein YjbJ (UPF0337 family)
MHPAVDSGMEPEPRQQLVACPDIRIAAAVAAPSSPLTSFGASGPGKVARVEATSPTEKGDDMDENLKRDIDQTIDAGKAETEEMRAAVKARADAARSDIDAEASQAEGQVREHFEEVRDEASQELRDAADEANRDADEAYARAEQKASEADRELDAAHDRLGQMIDDTRELGESNQSVGERIAHEAKGLFDSIRRKLPGSR